LTNSLRRSADPGFAAWFATLSGGWRLRRRYTDGCRFEGVARFVEDCGAMALAETGTLRFAGGGEPLAASRNWTWRLIGANRLQVHFRDPMRDYLYHDVSVIAGGDGWTGGADHDCGADHYRGRYDFENDRIVVRQSVAGPQKRYAFVTHYLRLRHN
jgi:Family of unknown function (DUF6314)